MNEANNDWTIVHRTKNNDYIRKIELISLAKQLKIDVEKQFMRNNKKLKKTELLQHIRNIYVNNIYKNILNMTDIDFNLSKFNVKNNPQKSSGNILSNNNSGCQERVKDNLIRNNKNLKKWQHNSKWIISKLNNHNLNHKLCQTGVCNNKINMNVTANFTISEILYFLIKVRKLCSKKGLEILRKNNIHMVEKLCLSMKKILYPFNFIYMNSSSTNFDEIYFSVINDKNLDIDDKVKQLSQCFDKTDMYNLILNISYHYVKNMNNNCEDEKFAKKFKISFSIKKI